jgi:hypothetical protein
MDYARHYERLISRARSRLLEGYTESHHVVPRCMGGTEDRSNLVRLTAEEHFVAHQLLHKMYPEVRGLSFALIAMTGNINGRRNKLYGWIRRVAGLMSSEFMLELRNDPIYIAKHKAAMDKLRSDPAYRERMAAILSKAHKGRVKSAEERANIAAAGRNRKPRKFSEQARLNMAEARKKVWQKRRETGEDKVIMAKTRATRFANGNYAMSEAQKIKVSEANRRRTKRK